MLEPVTVNERTPQRGDGASKVRRFQRPPVIETVLGCQFEPVSSLIPALFCDRVRNARPEWRDNIPAETLPIEPQFERFDDIEAWGVSTVRLRLSAGPPVSRLQLINAQANRMIQIQPDRFHFNWLGAGGEPYPSYAEVRPGFDDYFALLVNTASDSRLAEVTPNQWEVTYVNHIHRGTVWERPEDWANLFGRSAPIASTPANLELESYSCETHFRIPPRKGRLHIHIRHARQDPPKGEELLVVTLTARGPIAKESGYDLTLQEGLDTGHEAIAAAFESLFSEATLEYWEQANA